MSSSGIELSSPPRAESPYLMALSSSSFEAACEVRQFLRGFPLLPLLLLLFLLKEGSELHLRHEGVVDVLHAHREAPSLDHCVRHVQLSQRAPQDDLFHCVSRDQPDDQDGSLLPDSMRPALHPVRTVSHFVVVKLLREEMERERERYN